jgi:hypothetical protein
MVSECVFARKEKLRKMTRKEREKTRREMASNVPFGRVT